MGSRGLAAAAKKSAAAKTRSTSGGVAASQDDTPATPASQGTESGLKSFSQYITAPVNALLGAMQPKPSLSPSCEVSKTSSTPRTSETLATTTTFTPESDTRTSRSRSSSQVVQPPAPAPPATKLSSERAQPQTAPAGSDSGTMAEYESMQIVASQSALDAEPRGVLEGTTLLFTNVNDATLEQELKDKALALGAKLVGGGWAECGRSVGGARAECGRRTGGERAAPFVLHAGGLPFPRGSPRRRTLRTA